MQNNSIIFQLTSQEKPDVKIKKKDQKKLLNEPFFEMTHAMKKAIEDNNNNAVDWQKAPDGLSGTGEWRTYLIERKRLHGKKY